MTAENAISSLMSHTCSAVRSWMEEHPRAPLIRKLRIIVDQDVTISIPREPEGLHREFLSGKLAHPKLKEKLAAVADELRATLPAGAFPFRIDFDTDLRVGNGRAYVDPEFVILNAAGVVMESTTGWRHPFEGFEERLARLDEIAPETMEKTSWYVVRNTPEGERPDAPKEIFASTELAARMKGMMLEAPGAARKLMAGQALTLMDHDISLLERLHVAPAGPPLIELACAFVEAAPEPS